MENSSLPRTIDSTQMRQVNRSAILELVRQRSPIARSEISRSLGLSMPTVLRIVETLIQDGLVRLTGETAGETGRPRQLLEFNKNGGAVIGVDLGSPMLYGALASIGGEVLAQEHQASDRSDSERNFQLVVGMIQCLLEASADYEQTLLGIAVGVPGVTHLVPGEIEWAPSLNWRHFPLRSRLQEIFSVPVVIENDVNMAALGEQWFGAGREVRDMAFLSSGTGLGAGLVLNGVIYRGYHEAAGEVGYLLPGVEALGRRYGQFGAMENLVSATGIAERARWQLGGIRPDSELEKLTAAQVFQAARRGEPWAKEIVDEMVEFMSMVVANIATLLDPELIVLGGGDSSAPDLLIQPILAKVEGVIQHVPRLVASQLGSQAVVMGGIALVLHLTKNYYVVQRLR